MLRLIYNKPLSGALIWAFFIFVLCATPGRYIPTSSWLEILSFDKLVHAAIFFILCGLFFLAVFRHKKPGYFIALAFLLSVVYGAALEWMQANWFSERSADLLDIAADSFGCLAALLLIKKLRKVYEKMTFLYDQPHPR